MRSCLEVEGRRKSSAWDETRYDIGRGTKVFPLDKCSNSVKKREQGSKVEIGIFDKH